VVAALNRLVEGGRFYEFRDGGLGQELAVLFATDDQARALTDLGLVLR
jgi:hypothetical protein